MALSARAQRRLFLELEREFERAVRKIFLDDIAEWRGRINTADLTAAIAAGNIERALTVLSVTPAIFGDLERAIGNAYQEAGRRFMRLFPRNVRDPRGTQVQFVFNMRHARAEQFLARDAAGLVTRIVEDQRNAIRSVLAESLRSGTPPRTAALRLVGTGSPRQGGIIGLSEPQSRYLQNARRYLDTGDSRYFQMTLRDRRFDGTIRRAISEGRAVPAVTRERALTQYSNRLLRSRGETVARTETLNALRAGKHEAFVQGAEQARVSLSNVKRVWDATFDSDTRDTHRDANDQAVQGSDAPFTVGGYQMRYPGDSSLGAPASETINCRCYVRHEIDFIGELAGRE